MISWPSWTPRRAALTDYIATLGAHRWGEVCAALERAVNCGPQLADLT